MIYNIIYLSSFEKDVKKIDKVLKVKLKESIEKIKEYPEIGYLLTGDLQGFRSYHFKNNNVEYRIAYIIDDNNLVFIKFSKRENFYEELKRRL